MLTAFALGMGGVRTAYSRGDFTATDDNGNMYSGTVSRTATTYDPSANIAAERAAEEIHANAAARAQQFVSCRSKSGCCRRLFPETSDLRGVVPLPLP